MDLRVSRTLSIPAVELEWRFSRASGPGGQHVNTSSTRVELSWNIAASHTLSPGQRERLLERLSSRLTDGNITVSAAEQRSQLLNRRSAQEKLGQIIAAALAPDPPKRRATKPTKGSQRRRLETKAQRSQTKAQRRRPTL
ncbi:alternative ribosome rescue aminoacyl-tRNA hydrolase ArfB [Glutamicibacter creatinolyticus]|uniref:alternative ribosome rescue aminoacyl-tRNA hydrolase ArfB n=1 Tax=Glutamicibacter creatinolyticus TaxID=162496 RepID=UPI0031D560CA